MLFLVLTALVILIGLSNVRESYEGERCNSCGKIVAGTVYVTEPDQGPGLGWVL